MLKRESNLMTKESERLREAREQGRNWRRWGPYLSERSWGTVREDYSPDGTAWEFLTHDQARAKAYRWGEDGLAGICDRYQLLCFALAVWNGRDPILKERAFGVTSTQGNHGEDVKEYYFYLDSTPTHSYMKYLYKYPQDEFPYDRLVQENQARHGTGREFELLDTGIFDQDRYFDLFVEYAKQDEEDLVIRIGIHNRGPEEAEIHVLPHLWFRNIWAWGENRESAPQIHQAEVRDDCLCLIADDSGTVGLTNLLVDYRLGERRLYADADGQPLFTDNETNSAAVYDHKDGRRFTKDAFDRYLVQGERDAVNPEATGNKACIHYRRRVPAGGVSHLRLRLSPRPLDDPLAQVDAIIAERLGDADAFYAALHPPRASEDERNIQRQALAGLMWTKQNYIFDVDLWLKGDDPRMPPPASRLHIRNQHWRHLNSLRILSMPDKWEYPWFAAWDLAFHTVPIALVDPDFAKEQLWLMLFEQFQHPNGQIPAYEWEFSDLNPPVHAWAVWRVYNMDRIRSGQADREFLEKCFHKLMLNFTWWINKVDPSGNNIFEGGFLGLDNITVFDRSEKLPGGAVLGQSDATGWMGMYCLNLMRIALELAKENPVYESLAIKYFQHYAYVGAAMKHMGAQGDHNLWDESDGFFYDVLTYPDGHYEKLRVRSLVGLIPLYAVERLEHRWIERFQDFEANVQWFLKNRRDFARHCVNRVEDSGAVTDVLTIVDPQQLTGILYRMADPAEFRAEHGVRSLSRHHLEHPFELGGASVRYEPGEADSKIKGGNSNWRGPVWFPTSFLFIESLRKLRKAYGEDLSFEGQDGRSQTPGELAEYYANALISIFTRGRDGRRPVYADSEKFQSDPHWRNHILFYEYFDGDNGRGLGASHQTGWTALVASLIDEWRR
jgi:hypothetical protein